MLHFPQAARRIAQECSGIRVRQASRLLTRIYDEALRPLGIQASQLSVLIAVALVGENGGNYGAVARALSMDRTTLTRNLAPLEKAGLLRVSRSPTDARARIVSLTRAGEKLIERAFPRWEQAQQTLAALSTNSRWTIVENTDHMIHWVQPAVVIEAVLDVVEAAKTGEPLIP